MKRASCKCSTYPVLWRACSPNPGCCGGLGSHQWVASPWPRHGPRWRWVIEESHCNLPQQPQEGIPSFGKDYQKELFRFHSWRNGKSRQNLVLSTVMIRTVCDKNHDDDGPGRIFFLVRPFTDTHTHRTSHRHTLITHTHTHARAHTHTHTLSHTHPHTHTHHTHAHPCTPNAPGTDGASHPKTTRGYVLLMFGSWSQIATNTLHLSPYSP